MRLGLFYTDSEHTEKTYNTSNIIKIKGNSVIYLEKINEPYSYMASDYAKYRIDKISLCPISTATGSYAFTVSFDGTEYRAYKSGSVTAFIDNILDWYGYIAEHPVKLAITTTGEFYVHIVYRSV